MGDGVCRNAKTIHPRTNRNSNSNRTNLADGAGTFDDDVVIGIPWTPCEEEDEVTHESVKSEGLSIPAKHHEVRIEVPVTHVTPKPSHIEPKLPPLLFPKGRLTSFGRDKTFTPVIPLLPDPIDDSPSAKGGDTPVDSVRECAIGTPTDHDSLYAHSICEPFHPFSADGLGQSAL